MREELSPYIRSILASGKSNCSFTKEQSKLHTVGLAAIGFLLHPDFFDLPILPKDRHSEEGFYHTIEYLSDIVAFTDNTTKTQLATIYHISRDPLTGVLRSYCPLNLKIEFYDPDYWVIKVHNNSTPRSTISVLLSCKEGNITTDYQNYQELKLSTLLNSNLTPTGG